MPATTAPKAPISSVRSWLSDATQNRLIAVVLAMLVAVPLLASPADRSMTGAASLTMSLFALVLMTMLVWRARFDFSAKSMRQFLSTGANTPVLLLVGLIGVLCFFSPLQVFSVQQLLSVGSGVLLYFVVGYQFRQSKHLSILSSVILGLGGLIGFAGLALYQLNSESRAGVTLYGDAQPLASMLMVLLPVVGSLAFTDKNQSRARIAQFVAILMVGALLATQVRTAWVASFFSLVTLAFLALRPVATQSTKNISMNNLKHLVVWPVMFVMIAGGFVYSMNTVNQNVGGRAATVTSLGKDATFQHRIQTEWSAAAKMIAEKPLTGWGPNLYSVYQSKFTGEGVKVHNNEVLGHLSMVDQAHNFYLQTAAELGLPGLLLMLAALLAFLVTGFKRVGAMEAGIRRTLLMGSLAATVGFMVDAMASPSWQFGQVAMFLWLMMGIGTSCFRPRLKASKVEEVEQTPLRRASLISRPAAVALCLGVATLLPASQVAAQSDYDNGNDTSTGEKVAIGVGAAALGYVLLSNLLAGGAAPGAAGAGAAGGVAADGTVVGGAPGTQQ